MKKVDRVKLVDAMTQYLQLKELTSSQDKQMDGLKTVIEDVVSRYPDEWVDGVFEVEGRDGGPVGIVKEVLNAPRVLFTASGKPLNEIETAGLISELGPTYGKHQINVTRLRDVVQRGDREVLAILAKHGVVCEQATRLDIKAK